MFSGVEGRAAWPPLGLRADSSSTLNGAVPGLLHCSCVIPFSNTRANGSGADRSRESASRTADRPPSRRTVPVSPGDFRAGEQDLRRPRPGGG